MNQLESWKRFFSFEFAVKQETRYFYDAAVNKLLKAIEDSSQNRIISWNEGKNLWRAQIGANMGPHFIEGDKDPFRFPFPYSVERMKPLRYGAAIEGRVNPKGIPCLYLATGKMTAIAEIRPRPGDFITVAKFKTSKPIKLINCCQSQFLDTHINQNKESTLWNCINEAFSKPITNNDLSAQYAVTQIISELFKTTGYDGIIYDSLLGRGRNIALFDLDAANLIGDCMVYEVKKMNLKYFLSEIPK